MRRSPTVAALIALLGVLSAARGQDVDVPEPLAPWRDWVLYGEEFRDCPVLNGRMPGETASHICAWPGPLSLTVDTESARFSQTWTLYSEEWVPLPGDAEHWPSGVTVDGSARPVVARDGRPALRLPAGTYRIEGEIGFAVRPASLAIPPETGLVTLTLDGEEVARPEIDGGTLWLGLRPDSEAEEDRLDVIVHRLLSDTLPMRLTTRIELDIAGQRRELALTGAAVAGFVPEHVESELPVQWNADGVLRVQIRPGRWEITLRARAPAPVESVTREAVVAPWPPDEIWSFRPEPRLRVAALEGAEPVDAERSGVPPEWRDLASYRVAAEQPIAVVERSRTDAAQANRLVLRRDLWLDFDGGGFTARDRIDGRMWSEWRLDMAAPYTMTMASVDDEPLLVTLGTEPGLQGVELRSQAIDLTATARLPNAGRLPVTGYRSAFDDVTTTVHVPPGYRVLAALGADRAPTVWLERWRLLDVFLLLIVGAAAWRLFGPAAGIVALLALVIAFHEPNAPRWTWLNLLVAIALVRVAPSEGRLGSAARWYRRLSVAAVVLLLIPFTTVQLRNALYPQLERTRLERGLTTAEDIAAVGGDALSLARERAAAGSAAAPSAVDEITVTASRIIRGELTRYQPGALVQTGPGLPDWAWTRHTLSFGGPVDAGQTFRLVTIGPWLVALWRVASVALALALLWLLSGRPGPVPRRWLRGTSSAALLAVAALALPSPSPAQIAPGEFPAPALLEELKQRLTAPAACRPACADATAARVAVVDDVLTVELDLALQAPSAVPVPGAPGGWRPFEIAVDGDPVGSLYRDRGQTAWLSAPAGVHRVTLRGPVPPGNGVTLPFPLRPRRIAVDAPDWNVAGVADGRLLSGALELTRQPEDGDGDEGELGGTIIAPYVDVERRLVFDLDWRVRTTVTRVAPESGAFTLSVALLPNEAVLTPGIEAAGGRATVAFADGEDTVVWESRLPTAQTLTLTAAGADAPWTERWLFEVGPIWHAEYMGLPSAAPLDPDPSLYTPEYDPRPGETLTVALRRPEPASGDTIAIDTVNYERDVGARVSNSTLEITYRTTRGGQHVITLPEGSELDSVWIDGDPVPLELEGRMLGIPVTPGEHDAEIEWREPTGVGVWTSVPVVDLGGGASNIETRLDLPQDRWVLLALGPRLGPAILYWPELVALVLGALVLGRLAASPLRTHEWLLLGVGLSTFAWPVLLLFAIWAFAMSARGRVEGPRSRGRFNAMQVALGVLTVAALVALVGAIPVGLLGAPDMHIVSPVAGGLSWFVDRTAGLTPDAGALSVSQWFYKAAMLAWALWLSFALLRWLPWAWRSFAHGGLWARKAAQ